jgi:hypothetical protein
MSAVGKSGPFWVGTIAQLEAMGTDDDVAVGDPAWDETNYRVIYCLTAAAGSSTWGYKYLETIAIGYSEAGGSGLVKASFVDNTDTGSDSYINQLIAPYDGRFIQCRLKSDTGTPGSTDIACNKGAAGANPSTLVDTQTVNMASTDVSYSVTFDSDATFDQDDAINLTIDPASNHGNITGVLTLEFTVPVAS